ncbi:hypothetical protein OI450_06510 [Pectobacterium cacticida]|uniref:Uncharacterized protein n=1 Tax=Pectobacterium cacticida TaxID=69221 RepID=A0ABZ2G8Y7_9GAMM|nr:hypothetical protein [Pectobacterium cacticida]UYX08013.1 hypothetical protein OI450_06510 [Pectobacterium cacticida]
MNASDKLIDNREQYLAPELTKTLSLQALQEGDVLLFSPEKGSFISWAITFLTNAPVSHAAMLYQKQPLTIIEESPPQVTVNEALARFHDRIIYVFRHTSQQELSPVIDAGTQHLNNLEPYDNASLYIIGLLLLYKKVSLPTLAQKVTLRILKKLTATLSEYLQRHKNPGKLPMVCSQFVAQCFEEAGDAYQLHFRHPLLNSADNKSLLDKTVAFIAQQPLAARNTAKLLTGNVAYESDEDLCQALHTAIAADPAVEENLVSNRNQPIDPELAQAIEDFAYVAVQLSGASNASASLSSTHQLQANMNMFVFPGDLLQHCINLEPIGKINI